MDHGDRPAARCNSAWRRRSPCIRACCSPSPSPSPRASTSCCPGVKAQLAVKLFGPDLDGLAQYGKAIESHRQGGARDPGRGPGADRRASPNSWSVRIATASHATASPWPRSWPWWRTPSAVSKAGQVIRGNERYDILVRLAPAAPRQRRGHRRPDPDRPQRRPGAPARPGRGGHRLRSAADPPRRRPAPRRDRGERGRARHGQCGRGDRPAHRRRRSTCRPATPSCSAASSRTSSVPSNGS